MKLIFIYGPPAVGKLTVAQKLSKITNYKIFHNHLIGDLVNSLFDFNSKQFKKYSIKFRLDLLDAISKTKTKGIIMTFMYSNPEGNEFIKKISKIIKKNNGKVYFIQLICNKEELKKRVKSPSRKKHTKVREVNKLKHSLDKWNLYEKIPFVNSLIIDNTRLSPKKVANKIKKELKLK